MKGKAYLIYQDSLMRIAKKDSFDEGPKERI